MPADDAAHAASVLVLFGTLDALPAHHATPAVPADLDVLLQRRSPTLAAHPGQVSFPGGRSEPADAGPIATALREAWEETGLDPAGVEPLHVLPPLPLAVSQHLVTPVIAWWRTPSRVAAVDHAETTEVRRVPVADLLDPAARCTAVREVGARRFAAPAFEVGDWFVWGFTGIVLAGIFDALGWTEPWDAARERAV